MDETERGDPRIVHSRSDHIRRCEHRAELRPVVDRLRENDERRRLRPTVDLIERAIEARRRVEDPRMRDDGKELVDARPRNRPRVGRLGERAERGPCQLVPGASSRDAATSTLVSTVITRPSRRSRPGSAPTCTPELGASPARRGASYPAREGRRVGGVERPPQPVLHQRTERRVRRRAAALASSRSPSAMSMVVFM